MEQRLDDATLREAHERLHRKAIVVVAWFIVSYVGILLASYVGVGGAGRA